MHVGISITVPDPELAFGRRGHHCWGGSTTIAAEAGLGSLGRVHWCLACDPAAGPQRDFEDGLVLGESWDAAVGLEES